jgi:hypothetical protein
MQSLHPFVPYVLDPAAHASGSVQQAIQRIVMGLAVTARLQQPGWIVDGGVQHSPARESLGR